MTAYELMIKTNHYLIKGGELTEGQKVKIVRGLMAAQSDDRTKQSFYNGVKYPNNCDKDGGGHMYPIYFIPPYNDGKKYQTVIPMSPKTHILSANAYELEIIRLLQLLAPNDDIVKDMINKSISRLKTTCYSNYCVQGECYHTALPVLRFLAAAVPENIEWIKKLIGKITPQIKDKKKCNSGALWYYWLCLSELPFDIAKPEIDKYKSEMLNWLTNKSCVMNSEHDKTIHPVLLCILRNILCKYSEYEYIKNRQPYINEKDNRLYFEMRV